MTAAALRQPARWPQAVCAEMGVLTARLSGGWLGLLFLMMAIAPEADGLGPDGPFSDIRALTVMMFFLPLAQWRGVPALRAAPIPMDRVRLELARVACGAAYATGIFALCIALYTAMVVLRTDSPGTLAGYPPTYPLAQLFSGLAFYLAGAAVAMRADRPGRLVVAAFLLGVLAARTAGIGVEHWEFDRVESADWTQVTYTASTSLTIGMSLLQLAAAAAAVVVSAVLGARAAARNLSWRRIGSAASRALARSAHPRPAVWRGRRVPASLARIAARQFGLLSRPMGWPLLAAAVMGVTEWAARSGTESFSDTSSFVIVAFASFLWPLLVWMHERREAAWDQAQPIGMVSRRLVYAAAGLLWLWIAVTIMVGGRVAGAIAAGSPRSPAELPAHLLLGLPVATLVLYCAGTVTMVLSGRPVFTGMIGFAAIMQWVAIGRFTEHGLTEPPAPLSLTRALAPVGLTAGEYWSIAPVLLWTPLFLTAAVGAIWLHARWVRYGDYAVSEMLRRARHFTRRRRAVSAP